MHFQNRKNKNVLIVVAHRDDETLGLAGTIVRHVASGDNVYAISMTDGVGARNSRTPDSIQTRLQASIEAARVLAFTWLEGGDFPDNAMDSVPLLEVVKIIESIKMKINPEIVYTHSAADLNIDHRIVSQATLTAFRPQPDEKWLELRVFETASATDYGHKSITDFFIPNLYIDVSEAWPTKLEAIRKYQMEMHPNPHSRSLEGLENLAKYRGNQIGVRYAEAFEILRKIER